MWNRNQLACLEALGVPVYDYLGTASDDKALEGLKTVSKPVSTDVNDAEKLVSDTELSVTTKTAHYRLGPWFLVFPSDIPAESFDWLRDLSSFIGGRPVQVSHTPADKIVIDCSAYAQNQLSPEQKQALWAELKPALS